MGFEEVKIYKIINANIYDIVTLVCSKFTPIFLNISDIIAILHYVQWLSSVQVPFTIYWTKGLSALASHLECHQILALSSCRGRLWIAVPYGRCELFRPYSCQGRIQDTNFAYHHDVDFILIAWCLFSALLQNSYHCYPAGV